MKTSIQDIIGEHNAHNASHVITSVINMLFDGDFLPRIKDNTHLQSYHRIFLQVRI